MNRQRLDTPDPAQDALEENWWNEYAPEVEAIWAQPLPLRQAVRQHYMQRAKNFFLAGAKELPVKVLEVGCGSGWACRMIVERGKLHIIGIDISSSQIELANANAARDGIADICEYRLQNLADYAALQDASVSCVFIQSILHHLSWQEIHSVLAQICTLGKGTRVFIYEPIYPRGKYANVPGLAFGAQILSFVLTRLPKAIGKLIALDQRRYYDHALRAKVMAMIHESAKNNWVMSPKEIYFPEAEFQNLLGKYFNVRERYLCDNTAVGTAQTAVFYQTPIVTERFRRWVLPLAVWIDQFLYKSGITETAANGYVFMGYECTGK